MKRNSGEIVIGLLVGLAIGAAMLWINSGNYAQEKANELGMEVSSAQYLSDKPGTLVLTVIAPAAAGAGVGWLLDELSGDDKGESTSISINGEYNTVNISGDTSTETRTDTRTDNSVRESP